MILRQMKLPVPAFRFALLVIAFLFTQAVSAQNARLFGIVTEDETKEALIGVKIVVDSSGGTLTDAEGKYTLSLAPGKHHLTFLYEGYQPRVVKVDLKEAEEKEFNLALSTKKTDLDIVVISGSRYEKKLQDETVSIDVVKPYLIQNNNATDMAEVSKKVPGVSIIDGQANIRGGSGYAYGAGSRVQVLVDDLPMLSADLSEVRWNMVPVENIEQVEVIKGASSALYGSAAMNGVINVRTGWASEKPKTTLTLYQTVWGSPSDPQIRWWPKNEAPFQTGMFFSHRRRIGNLDMVIGANYNQTRNYLKDCDNLRGRINIKTKYKSKKIPGLSYGLNANIMEEKFGRFFFWAGDGDSAYLPLDPQQDERYLLIALDPHLTYANAHGGVHNFRGRLFHIQNYLYPDQNMYSRNYYAEYQYIQHFKKGPVVTAGAVTNISEATTNILGYKKYVQVFAAGYAQAEMKFFQKLSWVAGMRYEVSTLLDSVQKSDPTVRTGLSYHAGKATFLRASWGQSYRFPSLVERYVDADILGLYIFANPNLVPEKGWSSEIAVKQGLKFGNWQGFADLCFFMTQFRNMTEFVLTIKDNALGFQTQNITRARIFGMEAGAMGEGKIGPVDLRFFGGYTFVYPGDLQTDSSQKNLGVYFNNVVQSFGGVDNLMNSILRYRYRHQFKADIELGYKKFYVGANLNYYSYMEKIDRLIELFPGVSRFRSEHPGPVFFADVRMGVKITPVSTLSVVVKNMGNAVYSLRPAMLEAPRGITVQYKYSF